MKTTHAAAATAIAGMLLGLLLVNVIPKSKGAASAMQSPQAVRSLELSLTETRDQLAELRRDLASKTPPAPRTIDVEQAAPFVPPDHGRNRDPQARELSRKKVIESWETSLDHHRQQRVDPAFSEHATAAFGTHLAKLSDELGFAVVGTDCRSASCEVSIEWPTYDQAMANRRRIKEPDMLNCSLNTLLPTPDRADQPYVARVLFDECTPMPDESGI
jgi:hypothetical protein